jgi:hypothetical protein
VCVLLCVPETEKRRRSHILCRVNLLAKVVEEQDSLVGEERVGTSVKRVAIGFGSSVEPLREAHTMEVEDEQILAAFPIMSLPEGVCVCVC